MNENFFMKVEGVYTLTEPNTFAIVGHIDKGKVSVGDVVKLNGIGIQRKVKRIETFNEYHTNAKAGMNVGIIIGDAQININDKEKIHSISK